MKTTGMIRQLDSLGRIVLPIELRRTLNINTKDMLEILVEGSSVILRKYEPNCHFCGSSYTFTIDEITEILQKAVAERFANIQVIDGQE